MKLLTVLLTVWVSSCTFEDSGGGGGYDGPEQYEAIAREAVNITITELQSQTESELVWDWTKWPIFIDELPADGVGRNGRPILIRNGIRYFGYIDVTNYVIYIPEGDVDRRTIIHEVGHLVLLRNRIPLKDHHSNFHDFFHGRYSGR